MEQVYAAFPAHEALVNSGPRKPGNARARFHRERLPLLHRSGKRLPFFSAVPNFNIRFVVEQALNGRRKRMPPGFYHIIPPGFMLKISVGIIEIQGYFMNPFRHFHSYPYTGTVHKGRIYFPVVVPFRLCSCGITGVKENIAVSCHIGALYPPAQSIS